MIKENPIYNLHIKNKYIIMIILYNNDYIKYEIHIKYI